MRQLYARYRHLLPSVLLFGGFVMDVVTFRTLNPVTTLALLGGYAAAAAGGVVLGDRGFGPLRRAVPLILQFAFGALLSNALLFYWYGGTFAASWPVMIVVVALMASNEAFRRVFLRPAVQFGLFAFVFFSYCTLLFPFLLRSVSVWVFLLGGAAATAVSVLVAEAVIRTDEKRRPLARRLRLISGGTFAAFVSLYFLNMIPPIPLTIREAGIYHDVRRVGGEYKLEAEKENVFQKLWPGQSIALEAGGDGRIYAYTAIYAPTDLLTTIAHRWQRYDESAGRWSDMGRSTYVTRGGREGGFRGYTYRTITSPGEWRVIVESERGQEMGRLHFDID